MKTTVRSPCVVRAQAPASLHGVPASLQTGDHRLPEGARLLIALCLGLCRLLGLLLRLAPGPTRSHGARHGADAGALARIAGDGADQRSSGSPARGGGWIMDPAGQVLATTSGAEPFATRDIDLTAASEAKRSYPRYVF